MKNKTKNARQNANTALKKAAKIFPDYRIIDARLIDFKSQKLIAVTGVERYLPYTVEFLKSDKFFKKITSFSEGEILVDLENFCFVLKSGKKCKFGKVLKRETEQIKSKLEKYGGKLDLKGEHIIDLKSSKIGPHFDVNLLLGDYTEDDDPLLMTPKSVVNSFGGGSFRGEADYQVSATKWGVNPYENGDPTNRQFYLVENGKQIFYSGKITNNVEKAICVHSPNYTTITYEFNNLRVVRKIFILGRRKNNPEAVEIQNITVENLSSKERNIQLVAVGMFGFSNPDCQKVDIIYQTVINQTRLITNSKNEIVSISPDYYPGIFRDKMRFAILRSDCGYADSFTNNIEEFLDGGTYDRPNGLLDFSNSMQKSGVSFFALKKRFVLPKKSTVKFSDIIGASYLNDDFSDIVEKLVSDVDHFTKTYSSYEDLEKCFEEDKKSYEKYSDFIKVKTDDSNFDAYINNTLPFQVLYQSFVSRGFAQTQKGYREIGFREIQDLFASMYYLFNEGKKDLVKRMLSYWIENVYEMGYANHNFYHTGKEPGMCSDDQLWLIQAVYRYINLSGDIEFLKEQFKVAGSDQKRNLFDTMKAIVNYSGRISIGKHNLPLLDSCDWNDCLKIDDDYLNGPSKENAYNSYLKRSKKTYGTAWKNEYSESVMNGFLLVIALKQMRELAKRINEITFAKEMDILIDEKEKSLQKNAYINDYFARVLINRKNKNNISFIGSGKDGLSIDEDVDGSYYLNSFSWSLLSDVAKKEQISDMLDVIERYLKTPAGFKLCTNSDLSIAGSKQAATDHYYPGDRENGGVFKHAAMMAVVGMLRKSKQIRDAKLRARLIDNAFYMIDLVLPYKTLQNPYKLKGNPRFCTQYNNSKTMENIGPILSGTASWLTLAIYEIIGVEFTTEGIKISPVLSKEDERFSTTLNLNGTIVEINIEKKVGEYIDPDKVRITVDGKKNEGLIIPKFNDGEKHVVSVM